MSGRLRIPVATCRLQLSPSFGFRDAAALADYLHLLGFTDVYTSPILKARRGSTHGYDVTDPTRLNPELGTEDDFNAMAARLRQLDMGLLLDIVPNHMAASPENPWWQDVAENNEASPYAAFFDTDWLDFGGADGETAGYRRFFDVGELVGVRVEVPAVFAATHGCVLKLIEEGRVTGLRLDHIDGLYDPLQYLRHLQAAVAADTGFYVAVEKIISGGEEIPTDWPVCGTTGYEFARAMNSLFADRAGTKSLKDTYYRITGLEKPFKDLVCEKKKQVMAELFSAEMQALGRRLAGLSGEICMEDACRALAELTACLPVYRTYIRAAHVSAGDRLYLEAAFEDAGSRNAAPPGAMRFLKRVLLLDLPGGTSCETENTWLEFVRRWQQLTGAIMAKGFEDTVLYNYNCLVSLNEVGGDPDGGGLSVEDFHRWNQSRAGKWPHTLNATSTHDTKRSEDVRARISILSEITYEWRERLEFWMGHNRAKKRMVDDRPVPEPDTEILLYQTMLGGWPLDEDEIPAFRERLKNYMIKAVREAKVFTEWIKPNRAYEDALLAFTDAAIGDEVFLESFLQLQAKIAWYGALNSLSQLLLKIASPGVPDFYRGTELWDFSLVDPDNRRPVDFGKRRRLLDDLLRREPSPADLLASWRDGRIKLYATYKALNARRDNRGIFEKGDYLPLEVAGNRRENVISFARHYRGAWAMAVAPRFFTRLAGPGMPPTGGDTWGEGRIILPGTAPRRWRNIFTGEIIGSEGFLRLASVFAGFPLALLVSPV